FARQGDSDLFAGRLCLQIDAVVEGQRVTITGTAQDFGGGIIDGVEVSTDGGQHWFKATGRESWSYNWVVQASGTYTI
ncbi:Ig-like domain-containing protein, partial [Rhizobium johnstonii]|uniref:Ig-like domain-containing protein n=1 Tax=Rhizobium johnstonii TaxID=3019933 RepID=UPI003F9E2F1E